MTAKPIRSRRSYVARWTFAGAVFGVFFPLVAWRIAVAATGDVTLGELHRLHPTMGVVDLAPLVLGAVAAVIGVFHHRLAESRRRTEATARQIAAAWTSELHGANLELADALESRRRFHAAVTHELRSPLTAIVGYSDLAGHLASEPPELSEYVTEIYGAATAMLGMVNDLLDAAKLEASGISVEIVDVQCPEVIDEVVRRLTPLARHKGLEVIVDVDSEVECRADPERLRQILTNLIANAVKFTESGTVRVRASLGDDRSAAIEVVDDGLGIDAADLDRIFEAFESGAHGDGRSDSSGLGLAISKTLAEAMDGHITAESAGPGKGSTFRLTLPAADQRGAEMRTALLAAS